MFRQRLITTLILVPLIIAVIYYAPSWILASILLFLVALSGWEWSKLVPFKRLEQRLIFVLGLLCMVWLSGHWLHYWVLIGLMAWMLILFAVLTFPASQRYWGHPAVVAGFGLLLLPLFASAIVAIHQHRYGQHLIVYVFSLVWAVDIGAYLVGKLCGRHKLIPQVSPGKTFEGALGGVLFALMVALAGFFIIEPKSTWMWFSIALVVVVISMVGDLFISMLKRRENVKDSGHVLPGHGGMLDRLDSSIAALPFFYVGLSYLEFWY
jgi:phosphatidate cytidylyltransferase